MTLIALCIVVPLALGLGLVVGYLRGPLAGFATALGILTIAVAAYVGLVTLASPM
jgi:hypothetical protein